MATPEGFEPPSSRVAVEVTDISTIGQDLAREIPTIG